MSENPLHEPSADAASGVLTSGTYRPHSHAKPPLHPFWRFLISILYVVAANWIAAAFGAAVFPSHRLLADALYRLIGCALLVGGFAFLLKIFDETDDPSLAAMGLPRRSGWIREIVAGVIIGGGMITVAVIAIASFGQMTVSIQVNTATLVRGAIVLVLLLFGAMLEELMFRGYPFQRLMEALGPAGAIIVMSVFFGGMHLWNPHASGFWSWSFLNTILVGALFAIAYIRSRALWLPFGIHFGWNFALGVVYGLPVSGLHRFSVIVRSTADGSTLLTGGPYGLEASLTGAVVVLLGVIPVWAFTTGRSRGESTMGEIG